MRVVVAQQFLADPEDPLVQRFGLGVTLLRGELRAQVLQRRDGMP